MRANERTVLQLGSRSCKTADLPACSSRCSTTRLWDALIMAQGNCTCSVGRELIKGNWEEAVRLLMSGHEGERADRAAARKLLLEDGDIAGALKQMPRHLTVERAILEARPLL